MPEGSITKPEPSASVLWGWGGASLPSLLKNWLKKSSKGDPGGNFGIGWGGGVSSSPSLLSAWTFCDVEMLTTESISRSERSATEGGPADARAGWTYRAAGLAAIRAAIA